MPVPVALFVYNRPRHIRATLEALARNTLASQTDLYVFSDGAKGPSDHQSVAEVRRLASNLTGFASVRVVERPDNAGLANSIIAGVSELLASHDTVIVLEDDLVSSPHFLAYMNAALEHYRSDPRVFSVTGYVFPPKQIKVPPDYPYDTFSGYRCSSWSWGTWGDRWRRVRWDMGYFDSFSNDVAAQEEFNRGGQDMSLLLRLQYEKKIDSWAIRFCYAHYANNMRCIYPVKSLIRNIGLDHSGTHSKPDPRYSHESLDPSWLPKAFCPTEKEDPRITANFRAAFDPARYPVSLSLARHPWMLVKRVASKVWRLTVEIRRRIIPQRRETDVLVVNTFQKSGGAAQAAYRTFLGVRERYPATHYLNLIKEDLSADVTGCYRRSVRGLLAQRLMFLDRIMLTFYPTRQAVIFSPAFWPNPLRIPLSRFNAKLVHLHWVGFGMFRVEELSKLHCPVVWTLHDAWAFTGGCHYTGECEGFKKQCGRCPQLASQREDDISRSLMRRKGRAFRNINLTIVAPSRWLAEQARQSSLFADRRIEVIPNGLDTETFKPIDRSAARAYLNLPSDMPVLLFGTQSLTDWRKGGDLLCEALRHLDAPCTLLTFGEGKLPLKSSPQVVVRALGHLTDYMSLALVYSAADVFLCPSREDNLPNTVAEALACGTPCAAFDVTGLPDMIDHQKNGWLARPFDPADLARGIQWLIRHPRQDQLRQAAREKATSEYSMGRMSERYAALYADLLEQAGRLV